YPAYRAVAGDLRLTYSQFEELEAFSRFGTRLDEDTRKTLERGQRVRSVLKQSQYALLTAAEQIIVLFAVNDGVFDPVPEDKLVEAESLVRDSLRHVDSIAKKIETGEELNDDDFEALRQTAAEAVAGLVENQEKQTKT
ncbi:MAG: F0F1 ATP synthase subunit alpha, partial [Desulfuromonadales bacterium]